MDGLEGLISAEAEAREGWDEMREEMTNFWSNGMVLAFYANRSGLLGKLTALQSCIVLDLLSKFDRQNPSLLLLS